MGRKQTEATRAKISATKKALGQKPTRECAVKGAITTNKQRRGPKNYRWNPNKDADAVDRLLFQTYVGPLTKKRDAFTCALCSKSGGDLHSHHIKPFGVCQELRFSFVNVITLCTDCHYGLHSGTGNVPQGAERLWSVLRAQLTSKTESALELAVLHALRAYRDVLVAHQGDISAAWNALDGALKAYKEHKGYE